jgi:hypothetical protein
MQVSVEYGADSSADRLAAIETGCSQRNQKVVSVMYAQRGTLVTNAFVVNSFGCSLPPKALIFLKESVQ